MKTISVPGPISGRSYSVTIGGDEPTADDRQFIDSYVRQQEIEFAGQYQERFGEDLLPSRGVGAQVGEFFRGIPSGAGGLFETAALGLATPFGEETEGKLREGIRGIGQGLQERYAPPIGREDMVGGRLGQAVGSMGAIAGAGLAGTLVGGPLTGLAAAGTLGAGAGAGEASERARAAGATLEERNLATRLGLIPGVAELVPLVRLNRVLERGGFRERLTRALISGGEEGLQEAASSIAQNLIEQGVYNPERGAFEGTGEDLGYGAGAGALVQAIADLFIPGRLRGRVGDGTPPAATPTAATPTAATPTAATPTATPTAATPTAATPTAATPTAATPTAATPTAATPTAATRREPAPTDKFDMAATVEALRASNGNYIPAMQSLGVTYPELQQRVRQLESEGLVGFDRASGRMTFAEPEAAATPTQAAPPAPALSELQQLMKGLTGGFAEKGREANANRILANAPVLQNITNDKILRNIRADPLYNLVENPDGSATIVGVKVNETSPWVGKAPTQETVDAEIAPSGPVESDELRSGDGLERGSEQLSTQPVAGEPDTTPAGAPNIGPVGGAVLGAPEPSVAEGPRPDALTPGPAPVAEAAPAPVAEAAPAPVAEAAPVSPEAATVAYDPMSGAIPGVTTGAAGQVIPATVPPAPRFTAEGATIDPMMAEAIAAQEAQDKVAAQDAITAWYETNAAPEAEAARARITGAPRDPVEPSIMPAADMEAVAGLLRRAPKARAKGKISPERAAFVYFSKSPDTNYVLESIAYDQAQKMSPEYDEQGRRVSREADFRRETEFESADEAAFYEGTGAEVAMRAARWIRDNLSEATRAQVADYTFNKYRPIDYEAAAESRDVRRAQRRNQQAEVDQIVRDTYGDSTIDAEAAADLGFGTEDLRGYDLSSFAGQTEWAGNVHPRVAQLIRAGDFRGALQGLAITAPSKHLRGLAQKLLARIGDTPVQVVSPDVMNSIRAELSPETPTLGVETPAGVYVHPRNEAQIAAMRREGHDAAADLIEQYGGQILFNETSALAPELVLHEAVHRVADGILSNPSHPLTRQLDKLRTNLLKFMPATEYGLSNVRELLTEGMTNPVFRQTLSLVNTEGKPYSAWQEFKHIMRNFLRSVMGQQPVKPDSALTTLDRTLNAVLASNPNEIGSGGIVAASFAPGGLTRYLNATRDRLKEAPGITQAQTRRIMQDPAISPGVKDVTAAFLQPLTYAVEAAAKYLPSAPKVNETVRQYEGEKDTVQTELNASLQPISAALNKYDTPEKQSTLDEWQQVRLLAQLFEVDVRKPRSTYEGYSFAHNVLDKDGNAVKRVESTRFKTELERNRALQAFNAALPADAPAAARARVKFNEDAENLAGFDKLRPMWDRMPADLRDALNRSYAIPEVMRKKLDGAIRAQLENLLPGSKSLQERVYGQFYAKIMADSLIPSYQHLRRSGQYWLTFNSYDPITGRTELVKTSFQSLRKQQTALGMIERHNEKYYADLKERLRDPRPLDEFKRAVQGTPADPETGAKAVPGMRIPQAILEASAEKTMPMLDAAPYQNVGADRNRPRAPLEFVAKILDSIEGSAEITALDAGKGENDPKVRDQIIELFIDNTSETSFLRQFQKRAGRRGFDGDINALQEGEGVGDVLANIAESNGQLARQVVKLKYGAKMSGLRNAMEKEFKAFQDSGLQGVTPEKRAREIDEAARYLSALNSYTYAVFQDTASWASAATGLAYTATLGFNPSTAVLTTMSLPMFTAPYLGGRYGYSRMMAAMSDGMRALAGTGKYRQVERIGPDGQPETVGVKMRLFDFSMDNQDYSRPELQWKKPLHTAMKDNGMLYRSLTHDEMQAASSSFVSKLAGWSSIFQHTAERYVKETAAHAAYILELQKLMGATGQDTKAFIADLKAGRAVPTAEQGAAAGMVAVNATEKTNGPTFANQRPRMAQSDVGRVAYLFKGHPLAMMNLMWQTAQNSTGPKTEERSIARAQLVGMLSALGAVGGIMGMPMMQQVAMLHDYFWAEDDEPDFETKVRVLAGERGAFGMLDFFLGTKVSNRLALGDAVYRPAMGSETDAPIFKFIEGAGGPVVGLALKYTSPRTMGHFNEGRYDRFLESILPSAAANVARAFRYSTDGIENLRGDLMVDDIGPFHIGAQALGFMPTVYAQQLAKNSVGTRINNAIETKVRRLLQKRNKAIMDGDIVARREVEEEIREFQQRHPGRVDSGTLDSSIRAFRDRTAKTNYGLYVPPRNQAYIEGILNEIGRPTAFD